MERYEPLILWCAGAGAHLSGHTRWSSALCPAQSDACGLTKLPLHVAPESNIWADAGYTDYKIEALMLQEEGVCLLTHRKSNSKRKDRISRGWPIVKNR